MAVLASCAADEALEVSDLEQPLETMSNAGTMFAARNRNERELFIGWEWRW